jgi:glycosyltransferase involved in cell wall biosynthesis
LLKIGFTFEQKIRTFSFGRICEFMNHSDILLAIVIPAFKPQFLQQALASVLNQTDQRFRLYVGDDCGPDELASIVKAYGDQSRILYRRFPDNLGRRSLVGHWDRCIHLTNEPWVWIFSDDDVMERECVAAFYREIDITRAAYDVYRFNTVHIDKEGYLLSISAPHPETETSLEFAYHRLRGVRHCTAQEFLFSRESYKQSGGFLDLPCGWCSDEAGIIRFSRRTGIRTIPGPRIRFRLSGQNITSSNKNPAINRAKRQAAMAYLEWLLGHFKTEQGTPYTVGSSLLKGAAERWFTSQCQGLQSLCTLAEARQLSEFCTRTWGGIAYREFYRIMKRNAKVLMNRWRT